MTTETRRHAGQAGRLPFQNGSSGTHRSGSPDTRPPSNRIPDAEVITDDVEHFSRPRAFARSQLQQDRAMSHPFRAYQ